MEKTVNTLGELLAAQARQQLRRHRPATRWLGLLQPVVERNESRAQGGGRFERHEAAPVPARRPAVGEPDQPPAAEGGAGEPVPAVLRDHLRPVVGPGVDRARLHAGASSDAFARARQADAVTVGRDIYFQSASYAPQSAAGLGLLAHELSHVSEGGRPGAEQARARPEGARQEEDRAQAVEQRFARPAVSPLAAQAYAPPVRSPGAPAPGSAASSAESPRPMRAAANRSAAGQAPPAPSLDQLRQGLLRDVMAQIRVEFERGS